ncbi:hypothetical protein [Streptomyces sp. NBC_01304]|uniref:hypothetical protein n=1 Tax=Streptomyces sp. NBC_01304 TaxID=2903818 RepID=UPI002E0E0F25|nr:hypothetical protein OG430_46300 [Streptomyces sp. NBC_01304]
MATSVRQHPPRPGRRPRLRVPIGLALTAATVGLSLAAPQTAVADDVISEESFGNAALAHPDRWYSSWDVPKGQTTDPTGWACLTAASGEQGPLKACKGGKAEDKPGDGSLRLTDAESQQTGFILTRGAFPSGKGLRFQIGVSSYGSSTPASPADGISLFLLDGSEALPKVAGIPGAGLGYSGVPGGYVGVGLDEFGNFAKNGMGGKGGPPEAQPNSVTVRGATAAKNAWVSTNTLKSGQTISDPTSKDWKDAERTVRVDVSPTGVMRVDMDFKDGKGFVPVIEPKDLNKIPGQPAMPSTLRLGIAASTGAYTNIHEVFEGKVETLGPDLSTTLVADGAVTPGQEAKFTATTSDSVTAVASNGEITQKTTFPKGVTPKSASGDGWKCTVDGQTVTCKRPGTGDDALQPGKSAPPVTIQADVAADASGAAEAKTDTSTPGQTGGGGRSNPFDITPPKAKAPQTSTAVVPDGAVTPGQEATFTATTSDAATAGPTTGEIRQSTTFPAGVVPKSASGSGWTCTVDGQTVTCRRPGSGDDALQPGKSAPPVSIQTDVAPDASGRGEAKSETATPGQQGGDSKSSPFDIAPAPAAPPQTTTKVAPEGAVTPGKQAAFTATTSDAPGAGPTTGEITQKTTFPDGVTPKSASGDGWTCAVEGQTVTCKRPGTGDDALQPGKSAPPVTIQADVAPDAKGRGETKSETSTPGQKGDDSKSGPFDYATPAAKPAEITAALQPNGAVQGGRTAVFTGLVSNAKSAGPTTGPVTATYTFPKGTTPLAAKGTGWTCRVDGQTVNCTHPGTGSDALLPGLSYPPIEIGANVAKDAKGDQSASGQAGVNGVPSKAGSYSYDVLPANSDAPSGPPVLTVETRPVTAVEPNNAATFTEVVRNDAQAGPTVGKITVNPTYPNGVYPTSASGDGWDCTVDDQNVTCTRPGTGEDTLLPGRTAPPIKVEAQIDPDAKGLVYGVNRVSTPTDPGDGQELSFYVDVPSGPVPDGRLPVLNVDTRPMGPVVAGQAAAFTATVVNEAKAGPTTAEVKAELTMPAGVGPVSATGDGWKCSIKDQNVACTHAGSGPDALQPGMSLPPITVKGEVGPKAAQQEPGVDSVSTAGDPTSGTQRKFMFRVLGG